LILTTAKCTLLRHSSSHSAGVFYGSRELCIFLEPPLHSWHIAGGGRRELSFITLVNMVEISFVHAVQHANQAHHTANYPSCAVNPFSTRCFHVA